MYKRGYRTFLLYLAIFIMIPMHAFAAEVPEEVQKYADEHYLDVVRQLVFEKGPPADFGFQPEPGEISMGPLFAVYTVTPEFIKGGSHGGRHRPCKRMDCSDFSKRQAGEHHRIL